MKERKLKILIGIMAAALLLLTGIQIYWTATAIAIEEERFESSVNAALNDAALKLEKNRTAEIVVHKLRRQSNTNTIMVVDDSVQTRREILVKNKLKTTDSLITEIDTNFLSWYDNSEQLFDSTTPPQPISPDAYSYSYSMEDNDSGDGKNLTIDITSPNDTLREFLVVTSIDSLNYYRQTIVEGVLDEMIMFDDSPIDERISKSAIDTLVGAMLTNRGINTDYRFAVREENSGSWFYLNDEPAENFGSDDYSVRLFPKDLFGKPYFLHVTFPNQSSYILGEAASILGLSALLIAVITGIFYQTVRMFLKQKKITELKNDLINNISHEFKTPIASISLACDVLEQPESASPKENSGRYTKIIRDENERLRLLVENLLHTAAMENQAIMLNKKETNVHNLIKDVIDKFNVYTERNGTKVELLLEAANPVIEADPVHLTNIIGNLIDNAVKYCSAENAEIRIRTKNDAENLLIIVEDNGIGIPQEYLSSVFDTFFRVPTGNVHNVKGNGIGLSYVKKLTEAHSGSVSVQSKPGRGSTFTIRLPFMLNIEGER